MRDLVRGSSVTDLSQLAKSLTNAQRARMTQYRFTPTVCETREAPVPNGLARKGLVEFKHKAGGRGDWALTPLGEALRAHLKGQSDAA